MLRPARRAAAMLAVLASAALSGMAVSSHADAAGLDGVTLTGHASLDAAGDRIEYAFAVDNVAGPTLYDIAVSGTTSGSGAAPEFSCPQASLPAGVTEICTASYQLTSADMAAGTVSYSGTLTSTDSTGATTSGPTGRADLDVPRPTFIDSPDITNDDIGDISKLPGGSAVIPAYGNSWNPAAERSIDSVYRTIASYQPHGFLISGDLVEGRWGEPGDASGVFGPQDDPAARIQRMADFYHGENARRLEDAGLLDKLYAIPGDHDYGDNPWRVDDPTGYGKVKYDNFDIWRNSFYDHYLSNADGSPRFADRPVGTQWEKTAYATMISPDMLLVSVDVFDKLPNLDGVGSKVAAEVVGAQLDWLERVLAAARAEGSPVKWIVVQGHDPVLTPVRVSHSSGMHLAGRTTAFWQTMAKYKVNLYLAGEVHATTRRSMDGITQISTGSPVEYTGRTTFVAVHEYPDHLGLVDWGWNVPENAPNPPAWDGACGVPEIVADSNACPPGRIVHMNYDYTGYQPTVVGTLSINPDNTADYGTGNLIEYVNPQLPPPAEQQPVLALHTAVTPRTIPATGRQVTYTFTLANTGNVALKEVAVQPETFSGRGAAPTITCPQDTLPVGVSERCTAQYLVTTEDVARGRAVSFAATAGGVSDADSAVSSRRTTVRLDMPKLPAVSLSARTNAATIRRAGAHVSYTYSVHNAGNVPLTAVHVRRRAPSGTGTWSAVTCPADKLGLGADAVCTATYTSTQADVEAGRAIVASAVAEATSADGSAVASPAAFVQSAIDQRQSLKVRQRAGTAAVHTAGRKITYHYTVTNTGNVTLRHLALDVAFSGKGKHSSPHMRTTTLRPGARTTVTVGYTVAVADIAAGKALLSTATAHGRHVAVGPQVTSNWSRVRVLVR